MDVKDTKDTLEEEQMSDFEKLSPIKRNMVRIISAILFGLALFVVVYFTDKFMEPVKMFFYKGLQDYNYLKSIKLKKVTFCNICVTIHFLPIAQLILQYFTFLDRLKKIMPPVTRNRFLFFVQKL